MNDADNPLSRLPAPDVAPRSRLLPSLIWLVPLVAALVGLVLIVQTYAGRGPTITIRFESAEGLEAGKTEVRFKNVVIGRVSTIELSEDREQVLVSVDLSKDATSVAVEDTRFWVVRPRADLGGVSGLNTLLSGAYVGVDVGRSDTQQLHFTGLEIPPAVTNDQQGTQFTLTREDLGSLNIGSPIYFRSVPVGRVVGFDLDENGEGVTLQAFIDAPYDRFVTRRTRFWNASGVNVNLDANGLKLNTQSLVTLLAGGLAFQSLPGGKEAPEPAAENSTYRVYDDQATALAPADRIAMTVKMRFFQSMRGLSRGAVVDFKGVELGTVTDTELEYDPGQKRFASTVTATVYPGRLGRAYEQLRAREGGEDPAPEVLFQRMIDRGLRAQLRNGNLITGQLYVALDFMPKAPRVISNPDVRPLEIPTEAGSFDQLQAQIADIVTKIDSIPFGEIGSNLRDTLQRAEQVMKQIDTEVAPELRRTLEETRAAVEAANNSLAAPDAPLQQDLRLMMEQVDRAARSLRNLSDTLQRNPQSLLRGKPETPDEDE